MKVNVTLMYYASLAVLVFAVSSFSKRHMRHDATRHSPKSMPTVTGALIKKHADRYQGANQEAPPP